jgi:SAM-dependent methyltransferase
MSSITMNDNSIDAQFRKYLNFLWLRPENSFVATLKSLSLKSTMEFKTPSLDISCGDGMFTFMHLGGELDERFDRFVNTRAKEFKHDNFVDIYDGWDELKPIPIKTSCSTQISVGTDWKQGMLDRARELGVYQDLKLHDNNRLPLPFEDELFETIYSNAIYWISNPTELLSDMRRVLSPMGQTHLHMMTPTFLQTLDEMESWTSPEGRYILNRQRRETMPGLRTLRENEVIFDAAGFKVDGVESVFPHKLLIDIWNIGTRPLSHLLIRMAESLSPEDRLDIKREWVNILYALLRPFITLPQSYELDKAPLLLFHLSKK